MLVVIALPLMAQARPDLDKGGGLRGERAPGQENYAKFKGCCFQKIAQEKTQRKNKKG